MMADWDADAYLLSSLVVFGFFFGVVLSVIARAPRMFTRPFGRTHRLVGAAYLCCLLVGFGDVCAPALLLLPRAVYDGVLGVLGTALALTAAHDFRAHVHARNAASGTLLTEATVTPDEMREHAFYQALNLVQAMYMHALGSRAVSDSVPARAALCIAATALWLARGRVPVHSFSANYAPGGGGGGDGLVALLYRLKKYQYVFYKHFLLHGLNISLALAPLLEHAGVLMRPLAAPGDLGAAADALAAGSGYFRLYWLGLNTAYTMEFFLQTFVKRGYMTQNTMLRLQKLLMAVTTAGAVPVLLRHVSLPLAAASLALNFVLRKHDFANTCGIILGAVVGWGR